MAEEYLKRTPTSGGNRKTFTISVWLKRNADATSHRGHIFNAGPNSGTNGSFNDTFDWYLNSGHNLHLFNRVGGTYGYYQTPLAKYQDYSGWTHYLAYVDTTQYGEQEVKAAEYINGVLQSGSGNAVDPISINYESWVNHTVMHQIGKRIDVLTGNWHGQIMDLYIVDGQALTPDVFGFYKVGDGYVSAGTTRSTKFKPGQWVPKSPSVIKNTINNGGGFGVNGVYLPMNDSANFGADFHMTPDSIIKLQDDLPQPKVSIASTAQAGLAYTDVLRADPYAANLVLALPFVDSGLESGLGDYSHIISNSGIAKTLTVRGNVATISVASSAQNYYGSSATWDGSGDCLEFTNDEDFRVGSGDFTIEGWFRPRTQGTQETYCSLFGDSSSRRGILVYKDTSNLPRFELSSGTNSPSTLVNITAGIGVSVGDWHHLAVERYGDNASIYLNGVAVGVATNIDTVPGSLYNNTTDPFQVGAYGGTNVQSSPFNGQISDFRFYKGVAKYKGGFDVPKPYTPVGIETWRAVPDCTANNFAILNFVNNNANTLSNGSLDFTGPSGSSSYGFVGGTIAIASTVSNGDGYYFEVNQSTYGQYAGVSLLGISSAANSLNTAYPIGSTANGAAGITYRNDGQLANFGTLSSGLTTWTSNGDIIGVAIKDNKIWFAKNNTWISGDPSAGTSPSVTLSSTNYLTPAGTGINSNVFSFNFGQNPTFSGNINAGLSTFTDSNGKGLFRYEPPSGFLALCEDNLPTPAIKNPGKYFKTVIYDGDGNIGRGVVGVGFTPDLVWIKERSSTSGHHLFDSVRGPARSLIANTTAAETVATSTLTAFNSDGWSMRSGGGVNASTDYYVAWCWQAGAGTTSANTDGSINSVVSVNQDAGFSVITYSGTDTGSSQTIGHGLGAAPKIWIFKNRSASSDWIVYTTAIDGGSDYAKLNATDAFASGVSPWSTAPTSSVITVGTNNVDTCKAGNDYVLYAWAEIEGFSKFGSYVGNGNAGGPFVYCGFKPAMVIIKWATGSDHWFTCDSSRSPINPITNRLDPSDSIAEITNFTSMDFLSNGFKIRTDNGQINTSGGTFIFAAWAESPFKYANAK